MHRRSPKFDASSQAASGNLLKPPPGHYFLGEIETAVKNTVLKKAGELPRRSGNSKIKADRLSMLEGIAKYLVRLLLIPNSVGEQSLSGLRGEAFLWHSGNLLSFGEDGVLEDTKAAGRTSVEDLLFLDMLPEIPRSLDGGTNADDAFAHFSTSVNNGLLCTDCPSSEFLVPEAA